MMASVSAAQASPFSLTNFAREAAAARKTNAVEKTAAEKTSSATSATAAVKDEAQTQALLKKGAALRERYGPRAQYEANLPDAGPAATLGSDENPLREVASNNLDARNRKADRRDSQADLVGAVSELSSRLKGNEGAARTAASVGYAQAQRFQDRQVATNGRLVDFSA